MDLALVRSALSGRSPGRPAALPEEIPDVPAGPSRAAVLVPLFEEAGEVRVVLTRRSSALRFHTGQVAFPGGRLDPGESALGAALREAREEVGIDPASVEIVGELTRLSTVSSGTTITPYVGAMRGRPLLQPNPAEVERVFDVSLEELSADGVHRHEPWAPEGREPWLVHFYDVGGETIWGATARMLFELLQLVRAEH